VVSPHVSKSDILTETFLMVFIQPKLRLLLEEVQQRLKASSFMFTLNFYTSSQCRQPKL
jgi:hypothetical protein